MAKGEIACFVQFPLLSLCFKKPSAAEASESVYMRERIKTGTLYICNIVSLVKTKRIKKHHSNYFILSMLSYTTHPGVGVGAHVPPWLRFCMQVLKYYMYCIETFYNPTKLSHLCRLSS